MHIQNVYLKCNTDFILECFNQNNWACVPVQYRQQEMERFDTDVSLQK